MPRWPPAGKRKSGWRLDGHRSGAWPLDGGGCVRQLGGCRRSKAQLSPSRRRRPPGSPSRQANWRLPKAPSGGAPRIPGGIGGPIVENPRRVGAPTVGRPAIEARRQMAGGMARVVGRDEARGRSSPPERRPTSTPLTSGRRDVATDRERHGRRRARRSRSGPRATGGRFPRAVASFVALTTSFRRQAQSRMASLHGKGGSRSLRGGCCAMLDLVYLVVGVSFFVLMGLYAVACDRL